MNHNYKWEGFTGIVQPRISRRRVLRLKHSSAIVAFVLVSLVVGLVLAGCGSNDENSIATLPIPIPTFTKNPSQEDIIEAVRRSVNGKTYSVSVPSSRQESVEHTCSQMDVDLDPYMPHNPELARCPKVGATYKTWITVDESETQTRTCEPLPEQDAGWHVEEAGDNKWRVSINGSTWDVEKLDGASANVGEYVAVSDFAFMVTPYPNQDC